MSWANVWNVLASMHGLRDLLVTLIVQNNDLWSALPDAKIDVLLGRIGEVKVKAFLDVAVAGAVNLISSRAVRNRDGGSNWKWLKIDLRGEKPWNRLQVEVFREARLGEW